MEKLVSFAARLIIPLLIVAGCQKEVVGPPEKLVIETIVTDASAFNSPDGAIQVILSGMEGPFRFFWSTGDSTQNISGLFAGDYTLKVTFGSSGTSQVTATVSQPDPPSLTIGSQISDVSRYGKADGSIALNISGGTGPYSAVWNTGDSALNYTGLRAGTYQVSVTDHSAPFQITGTASFTVQQPGFICGTDSIADADGNLYPTVEIDGTCWMARNLKTEYLPQDPASLIEGRFCAGNFCFNEEGAHYTWDAAMNGERADPEEPYALVQGICPDGWYLPSRKMFRDLDSILSVPGNFGDGFFSGTKMKGEGSSSGFDALITGNWGYGVYSNDEIATFWTSTEYFAGDEETSEEGYYFLLTEDTPFLSSGHLPKNYGMNIRCIMQMDSGQ